jgi:CheY-like chemotaxis protein
MTDESAPAGTYRVSCWSCRAEFDASTTRWCDCVTTERTRVCSACGRCFCKAPRAYKQEFWSGAPQALWDDKIVLRRRADALPPNPAVGEAKRPLILVCEDEKDVARLVVEAVGSLGYGWIRAADGAEGFSLAKGYRPDLVLTDALMPRIDGRELCRMLKADPDTGQIPVIVMTSLYVSQKYRFEALQLGADEYLVKPFERGHLAQLLGRFVPLAGRGPSGTEDPA